MAKAIELSGEKYGYLTVVRFSGKKGRYRYWECKCKCGRVSEVSTGNLRAGLVKSCYHCSRSETKMSEKNPNWRGDNVGYYALHHWVSKRKQKPKYCEECCVETPLDLANFSDAYSEDTYTRELKNWRWLCRRCHMKIDKRMKNLKQYQTNIYESH